LAAAIPTETCNQYIQFPINILAYLIMINQKTGGLGGNAGKIAIPARTKTPPAAIEGIAAD
jgi:hypothetical protein